MRDAASELDNFEATLNVALGVGEGFAVFGRQQPGERVEFLLGQVEEFHHDACAPLRVRGRPGRLRRFGNRDRLLDLGMLGEGDFGLNLAGVRIENVAEPSRSSLHLFAADEVADLTHEVSPWTLNGARRLRGPIVQPFSAAVTG